jgi:hypothetical protein
MAFANDAGPQAKRFLDVLNSDRGAAILKGDRRVR